MKDEIGDLSLPTAYVADLHSEHFREHSRGLDLPPEQSHLLASDWTSSAKRLNIGAGDKTQRRRYAEPATTKLGSGGYRIGRDFQTRYRPPLRWTYPIEEAAGMRWVCADHGPLRYGSQRLPLSSREARTLP